MSWTTPTTWNVGDPATSSDLNAYVRDNTAFLYGDTGWTNCSLLTGFTAGSVAPGFRKIGTEVAFRGSMVSSTPAACFNLPAGYFPAQAVVMATQSPSGPTLQITAAGVATMHTYSGSTSLYIDGLRFSLI